MALVDILDDAAHLAPPPQPAKVEVHPDDPQFAPAHDQFGKHRAARLERRQVQRLDPGHLDIALHQDGIAVPAEVARIELEHRLDPLAPRHGMRQPRMADPELDRLVHAVAVDQPVRHRRRARPEALVRLLQRDDIGVHLLQHVKHAVGPPPPVGADGLAHVVGGDGDGGRGHSPANRCRVARFPAWRQGKGMLTVASVVAARLGAIRRTRIRVSTPRR